MLAAVAASSLAFQGPALRPVQATRAAVSTMGVEDMPGKYALAGTIFDPLDLASKYDVNWLREAELKHGRICMLAFLGWITVDAGITFPQEQFVGIKSLAAHDAAVANGSMWSLLLLIGAAEFLHLKQILPLLDADWGDKVPGDFGLDPLKLDSPKRREIELKNGRAAMIAFSGLVTQCALGYEAPYF